MRRTLLPTALLALLALVACNADRSGGGGAPAEQPPPATEAIDPASVASLVGIVRFAGEPPPRELIPMGGDQFCRGGPPVLSRRLLVGEGGGVEEGGVRLDGG